LSIVDDAIVAKVPKDAVAATDDEYHEDIDDETAAKVGKDVVGAIAANYREDVDAAIAPKVQMRTAVDHHDACKFTFFLICLYSLCTLVFEELISTKYRLD
jgi:hypothetical protein